MTPFLVAPQFTPRTVPAQPSSVKRAPDAGPRPDFARRSKTHVLASDSILLLVAISLTLACTTDFGGFSASRLSLGSIICALGWLPTIVYLRQANRSTGTTRYPFTGLFYFAACGLPAFLRLRRRIGTRMRGISIPSAEALTTVIYALLALYAGYYLSFGYKHYCRDYLSPFSTARIVPLRRLTNFLWVLLALHLGALIFRGHVVESALGRSIYAAGLFCVWHAC